MRFLTTDEIAALQVGQKLGYAYTGVSHPENRDKHFSAIVTVTSTVVSHGPDVDVHVRIDEILEGGEFYNDNFYPCDAVAYTGDLYWLDGCDNLYRWWFNDPNWQPPML